ncbi:protein-export membrane protein SecD [Mycoplasma haemofelis Ohio2]|uniref:Protein-export membrane protein SecD n=1 Tax=Mycoplasma haemofelis (strain Ohio2) TaxID=859194 RepID=F6FFI8_MYCHI|nr:protein-export membrane protein SecD [Mycoplasma haemofelis Ohio2]
MVLPNSGFLYPSLSIVAFLIAASVLLYRKYSVPGVIFPASIALGLVNILAILFFLGSSLSLIGFIALVMGIFYAIIISLYLLNLLKKLFDFEFISRDNLFLAFKKNIAFAADLTLPTFIFSVFVAFLAPLHLREFGISLSLSILVFFPLIALLASSWAIQYARNNFLHVGNWYKTLDPKEDAFIVKMKSLFNNKYLYWVIGCLLSSAIIMFFTIGINSPFLFKKNYLVTIEVGDAGNIGSLVSSVPNFWSPFGKGSSSIRSYLVDGSQSIESIKSSLGSSGSFSIQETNAFNDATHLKEILKVCSLSLLLISTYIFIRFGFKNLLLLWVNTFSSLALCCSCLIVARVPIVSSIFTALLCYFFVSLLYHLYWFSSATLSKLDWFNKENKYSFFYGVDSSLKLCLFSFFLTSLLSVNEELILLDFYVFTILLFSHYISKVGFIFLEEKLDLFKDKYLWRKESEIKVVGEKSEVENFDEYDEELISDINS